MSYPRLPALPLPSAHHILDVGTGVGALIPDIRAAAPGAVIIGADHAEGMLRVAQQNASIYNASLALMDAQHLAVKGGAIDVAILAFVLFHVSDAHQALVEVNRVLRQGGAIGTITWGSQPSFPAEAVWEEELTAHGAGPDPATPIRHDDLMDAPDKIGDLLERAGFMQVSTWKQR